MGLIKKGDIWHLQLRRKDLTFFGTTGCTDKREAEDWMHNKITELKNEKKKSSDNSTLDILWDDLIQKYIKEFSTAGKKKSFGTDLRCIGLPSEKLPEPRYFTKHFSGMRISEIKAKPHIKNYIDEREKDGVERSSIERELNVLSAIFTFAIQEEYFSGSNPMSAIKRVSIKPGRVRFLYFDEFKTLMDAAVPSNTDKADIAARKRKLREVMLLAVNTGLIESEMHRINIKRDFDRVGRMLWIEDGKTEARSRSYIKLNESAFRILNEQTEEYPWRQNWRTAWRSVLKKAGLNPEGTPRNQKVVFYTLRHTFASWLLMAGKEIYDVAKAMRCSVEMIEKHYGHLSPRHSGHVVGALDDIFGNKKSLPGIAQEAQSTAPKLHQSENRQIAVDQEVIVNGDIDDTCRIDEKLLQKEA